MVIPGTPVRVRLDGAMETDAGRALFFGVEAAHGAPAIRDGVALISPGP